MIPSLLRTTSSLDSQAKARLAAHAALEKQAEGVVVMDVRALSNVTDCFVVCTAGSARQIAAITEHIDRVLSEHGGRIWHTEGTPAAGAGGPGADDAHWVLMDCGDIVVHLFDQRARIFYRLEELWADAPRIPLDASR